MKRFYNTAFDKDETSITNEEREKNNKDGRLEKRKRYLLQERIVDSLNKQNGIDRDNHVKLDEPTHIYHFLNGGTAHISATTLISVFTGKFRSHEIVWKMFKDSKYKKNKYDENFRLKSGNYAGMNKAEILDKWNSGASYGTECHAHIEKYLLDYPKFDNVSAMTRNARYTRLIHPNGFDKEPVHEKFHNCLKQFIDWETKQLKEGWVPFFAERVLFMKDDYNFSLAGSIDAIYVRVKDGKKEWMLVDWKTTSKKLAKKNGKYKYPLQEFTKSKVTDYSIQLSIYKRLLERHYGMDNITCGYIVQLDPKAKNYTSYEADFNVPIDSIFDMYHNHIEFAEECRKAIKGKSNKFKLFPMQHKPLRYQNDKEYL